MPDSDLPENELSRRNLFEAAPGRVSPPPRTGGSWVRMTGWGWVSSGSA